MRRKLHTRDFDAVVLVAALALAAVGLAAVYSAGVTTEAAGGGTLARAQALRLSLGLTALLVAAFVPFRVYESLAYLLYPIALLLLVLVQILGGDNPRGERWLHLGPFTFEPSELAKLAVILALARYLSRRRGRPRSLAGVIVPFILVAIPVLMVARQPDLGSALILGVVVFPMLYWAGLNPLYLVLLVTPIVGMLSVTALVSWVIFIALVAAIVYFSRLSGREAGFLLGLNLALGIGAPYFWNRLAEYQQERILTFLDPSRDSVGAGYQILQSKVALGSGGLTGKGFLGGTQKALSFLPAQHTDFIFSVVGEEFGFLGSVLVLAVFFLLVARGLSLAGQARNKFAGLLAVGIVSSLAVHVAVNVGMTMGLMPVTGLPLPLISYGGSSLLMSLASVGILLNVGMRRREY